MLSIIPQQHKFPFLRHTQAVFQTLAKEKHFSTLTMMPLLTQKGQTVLINEMLNHPVTSAALQTNKVKKKEVYEATPTNCPVHT